MVKYYGQINDSGFLVGVSQLSAEVQSSLLIEIDGDDFASLQNRFYKAKYENGQWIEGATPEEIDAILNPVVQPDPRDERIAQLEQNQVIMQETINFLLGI